MSQRYSVEQLRQVAQVSDTPVRPRVERNFGLPTGLYIATVGLYLAFIGLMAAVFHNRELTLPLVVIALSIAFGFGVAGYWTRFKLGSGDKPMTWAQLSVRGIETLSGRLTAGEAATQVLLLPVLILVWGLAIAVIVALT